MAEDQEDVPSEVVVAVLRSITLTDDIAAPASALPASPPQGAAPGLLKAAPPHSPTISTRAQFSYGVHAGALPKAAPEYIGATNRAARRRARLAELDERIAQAAAKARSTEADLGAATALLDDFRRARRELPDTRDIAKAAEQAGRHAALLAHARTEADGARNRVDEAIAEADARTRQLRHAAAERRMPSTAGEVDSIARAAAEFENAAIALHGERATLAQAQDDLGQRTQSLERQRAEQQEAEAAATEAERIQEAFEEEFRALEEALQQDVQQVLEQVRQAERELRDAQKRYAEHDKKARHEHDNATAADRDVRNERQALADAIANLHEQARNFGAFTRPDLRPLLGVDTPITWPEPAAWRPAKQPAPTSPKRRVPTWKPRHRPTPLRP